MTRTWQSIMRFAASALYGRVRVATCADAGHPASALTKRTRIRAGGLSAVGGKFPE
jgi:hypothetical protein